MKRRKLKICGQEVCVCCRKSSTSKSMYTQKCAGAKFDAWFVGNPQMPMSAIVVKEISVVGSRCGPLAAALRLMATKKIDPSALIEKVFPLSQGLKAFEQAAVSGTFKVLLAPNQSAKL